MTIHIASHDARRHVLSLQGLAASPRRRMDALALHDLIARLGFVQLDSIQTVARAHHMILHARCDGYRPDHLRLAHERNRTLFEHWTHDASIIPIEFYPHWNRRFARQAKLLHARFKKWHGNEFDRQVDAVIDRIDRDGPLMARDFAKPGHTRVPGWWNWHDGKIALEYLWHSGRLAVSARQNFQKLYDLTERVVPAVHARTTTSDPDFVHWACESALDRLGFASPGDIARFWDLVTIDEARDWCARAEKQATARAVVISSDVDGKSRSLFARSNIVDALAETADPPARIRALSPFDPLIRDRKRLAWLFGFDYRIEVFVPAAKRHYGYYVFPLLEGDRLIGRIDMAGDRDSDVLQVKALWLEPGIRMGAGRAARIEAELDRQRRFIGVSRVRFADGYLRR